MIVKYGDLDISDKLLEFKRIADIKSDTLTLFGNAPSVQLVLKIDNQKRIIQSSDKLIYVYDDEKILKGTYFIYEAPERYTSILTITAFDYILRLNMAYDSKLDYPLTPKDQLDEISALTGLSIDYSNLDQGFLKQDVNWYDNTLSCRNYIAWIAECNGMNVYADPSGIIKFKSISVQADWTTKLVEDYDWGDNYKVSRVCFDNGIIKLTSGNDTGNTIYLSQNNPYIDTIHDPTQKILSLYNGLELRSITAMKAGALDNLMLFDVINFDGNKCICLSLESVYKGGSYQIQKIDGVLPNKNAEQVVVKYDVNVRIKKLEVLYEQNEQKLEIIAQDVKKIPISSASAFPPDNAKDGQIWVDITKNPPQEKIYQSGEWVIVGDFTGDISSIASQIESLNTSLTLEQGKIETLIKNNTTIINGNEVTLKEAYSYIQQEVDAIQLAISESGGNNKLLNSCGWNGMKYWETTGDVISLSNSEIRNIAISGYAFMLKKGSMKQSFKTIIGRKYNIGCKIKKFTNSCTLVVKNGKQDDILFNLNEEYKDGWISFSMPIEAMDTTCAVYIESDGEYLYVSDLMLNDGEISQQWSSSNDEIYTMNVKIDRDGIEISQDDTQNKTVINTQEFSGYEGDEKVFSVNGDITAVNRLKAKSDVQIGNVRAYAKTTGSKQGIGFAYIKGGGGL